jgi:hypothetical protein
MYHQLATKSKDPAGILLELATLSEQGDPDLQRKVRQWNQCAPYLDNLPIRLRSIPQYLTINENHFVSTGGLSLSWRHLPALFEQYHTGGQFDIEVSPKLADRFIPGAALQLKHQDNLLDRPEYVKTFGTVKPIQFFKNDPARAKTHFEEEALRQYGVEFLLATATILSVTKNDQAATIRVRVDNTKDKDTNNKESDLLAPFLRHLAYTYSLSLSEFLQQIPAARAALNRELAASANNAGQEIPRFLHHYTILCLASPKQFNQLSAKKYLEYIRDDDQARPTTPTAHQLLANGLLAIKEQLPAAAQQIAIVPGEDPQIKQRLLEKTGSKKTLQEYRPLLEQIAGPKAVERLTEILLNSYLPNKPLDHKNYQGGQKHATELDMPVAVAGNSAEAEADFENAMDLRSRLQDKALYDHRFDTAALEDPEEFRRQYRKTTEHLHRIKLETNPTFVGALRYTPDYQKRHQTGQSYPQRVAQSIEAITPNTDLLPLKRAHYTAAQLLTLFRLPNTQANREMAHQLALSISAGRQENQVDRTLRRLIGAVHYQNYKLTWSTQQAESVFRFVCASATRTSAQLSRVSNPIPFLLKTGAFEEAAKILATWNVATHQRQALENGSLSADEKRQSQHPDSGIHKNLDLILRAQAAVARQVSTSEISILSAEREQAPQFPEHFVIATQLALAQNGLTNAGHPTTNVADNSLARVLGIRLQPFQKEEHSLPILVAARLLNLNPTQEQIESTFQKLETRVQLQSNNLDQIKLALARNPAYQLDLDPDTILKAIRTPPAPPAEQGQQTSPANPAESQESHEIADLLNSLQTGRKGTPWTATAALLLTAAEQSGNKDNAALIKIPGEKPVELKIKLHAGRPSLRLTSDKTEPNGRLILEALQQEITLLYDAKKANTLAPVETVSLQKAASELDRRRLPAILSNVENLLARQDGGQSLKTFVRAFRTQLNGNSEASPNHTLGELKNKIEQTETELREAKTAISRKDPGALQVAEHLTLQQLVHQAYLDQTDKVPGIWISGTEIQTNRLWILNTLQSLQLRPQETKDQSAKVLQAFENGCTPFEAITPPIPIPSASHNTAANNHYTIKFSPISRLPEFEITPNPFQEPFHIALANRASYRLTLQHAIESGTLELPAALPKQNKEREARSKQQKQWIGL